jgi:hypothetical protein
VGPVTDGVERVGEGASFLRQLVLDPDRRVGEDVPLDDALFLQFLEPLAEHAVGDVGNGTPQLGEPAAGPQEQVNDGPGPLLTDQLDRLVECGAELRKMFTHRYLRIHRRGREFHSHYINYSR